MPGVNACAIVVAPDHEELGVLRGHLTARTRTLDFVVQSDARGTADAVLAAERWIDDDPFLVMNGDNLYPAKVIRDLATCDAPALPGFERTDLVRTGNIEAARVNAFALVETDEHGYLTRIVEKPEPGDASPHALVSMNCWRFDRRIFDACRDVPRSPRGEYELPLAVGLAIQNGVRFKVLPAQGPILDLSQRADAAEVSRRLSGITPRP